MVLRWGIIGTGAIGLEHIRNIGLLPQAEVVAIADNDEQSREWATEELRAQGALAGVRFYDDFVALLEQDSVDAVIIATPNFHHIQIIRFIAEMHPSKQKHLLVEKPLCTTVRDCLEVKRIMAGYQKMFWVGMEYRYIPTVAQLIRTVDSGDIGSLKMVSIREHRFPFLLKVRNWNRFKDKTGDTLVEKCCHFFDLMRRICKPSNPVRIFASGAQDVNHLTERYDGKTPDILDNAFVIVDFDSGIRCMLDICMFAENSKYQEEIVAVGNKGKMEAFAPGHGDKSEITLDAPAPNFRLGKRLLDDSKNGILPPDPEAMPKLQEMYVGAEKELLEAGYHGGATFYELQAFGEAVAQGRWKSPTVGMDDGIYAVAMGTAAQISIAEKRVVNMSEILGPGPSEPSMSKI